MSAAELDGLSVLGMTRRLAEEQRTNEQLQRDLSEEIVTSRMWAGHAKAWRSRAEHAERLLGAVAVPDWTGRVVAFALGVAAGVVLTAVAWRWLP